MCTNLAIVSGLRLDPHGAGSLILGQSLWFIVVGILLWKLKEKQPTSVLGAL